MDIVICRFFNVFGPHQDFKREYPPFTSYIVRELINNRKPVIYNTSDVNRDYIFSEDLIEVLYRMAISEKKYDADIFNLCTGKGYTCIELFSMVCDILNKDHAYIEGAPSIFWGKHKELFEGKYPMKESRIEKEVFKNCIGDNTKIKNEFGYDPKTDIEIGLRKIIEYQKENFSDGNK